GNSSLASPLSDLFERCSCACWARVCAMDWVVETSMAAPTIAAARTLVRSGRVDMGHLQQGLDAKITSPPSRGGFAKLAETPLHTLWPRLTQISATAWFTPAGARLFVGRQQAGGARTELADACLGVGMGGQPLRRAAAAGGDHVLPQVHGRARIEAGLGHEPLADDVGFGFLVARVRQQEEALRRDAAELGGGIGRAFAVA